MKAVSHTTGILVLLFFIVVSQDIHAGEQPKIRIGVCLSLTDENGEWGIRSLAGMHMRLNEWKNKGGTPEIELLIRDDKGSKGLSKRNVTELVEKEKVVAIIGPSRSEFILEERDYLKEHKVIAISPNATRPGIGVKGDWIFRLLFDDVFQAQAIARYAYENLHFRRAAVILNTNYPYPESVFKTFQECFTRLGGEIVTVQRYDWKYNEEDVYDFHSVLEAVAESEPDCVLAPLYPAEIVEIMNESLSVKLDAPFLGTDTWDSEILLESGGNKLQDAHYVAGFSIESESPEMRHFLSLYNMSNEANAEYASVFGYDAFSLVLYALQDAATPDAVHEKFTSLKNYPLATGPITMDPKRGAIRPAYIHHIVKDGDWFKTSYVGTIWPEGMGGVGIGEGCSPDK